MTPRCATWRESRPGHSPTRLLGIRGVGERKLADLGQRFLDEIVNYCRENRLPLDDEFLSCGHLLNDGVPYVESALVQKGSCPYPKLNTNNSFVLPPPPHSTAPPA